MYAPQIIEERLSLAAEHLGFRPEYHTPSEIEQFNKDLERRHPIEYTQARRVAQGSEIPSKEILVTLTRLLANPLDPKLTRDEVRWIRNERALCMCDAMYFLTRYYTLLSDDGYLMRFQPRSGQKVLLNCVAELERLGFSIEILLAKARQLGMCLDPDTKVLLADLSWKRIGDVQPGDRLVSTDEGSVGRIDRRKLREAVVEAKREVFEYAVKITTDNGTVVTATPHHRWLCRRSSLGTETRWLKVSEMRIGDQIRYITDRTWGEPTYEDGWFGGLLDGEGSLRPKERAGSELCVAQVEGDVLRRAERYLLSRGYSVRYDWDKRKSGEKSKLGNQPVCKLILGRMDEIFRLIGTTRPSRLLPKEFWQDKELPGKKSGIGWTKIVSMEVQPMQRMVDLQTSTKTFIAEGLVSHNSTMAAGLLLPKVIFAHGVSAVMASADDDKTRELVQKMFLALDNLPWYLPPAWNKRSEGAKGYLKFGSINSGFLFQHGSQTNPIAMGTTIIGYHISEVSSFPDAEDKIEVGLFKAVHPNRRILGILEATCKGDVGWWADSYWDAKKGWPLGESRLLALFLPFYLAEDMYPNEMERRAHPVPANWQPMDITRQMVAESELYVQSNPVLAKVLSGDGKPWKMHRDQVYYWEWNFKSAMRKGSEKSWYSEMPHCLVGDTMISTERGIVPIREAHLDVSRYSTEAGKITAWLPQGSAETWRLETKDGRELYGTAQHLIQTPDGWCALAHLSVGRKIVLEPPRFACFPFKATWEWMPLCQMSVDITPEMGRLLGYFMGDGSFWGGQFDVAGDLKDLDVKEDMISLLTAATGKSPYVRTRGKMWRVQSNNQRWSEVLKALECVEPAFHRNLGRSCGWKRRVRVPPCIFRSPKAVVKEFLSAVFECDGHAHKAAARVHLFSKYDHFLREIQLLLLGFGIKARFGKRQIRHLDGHDYTGRILQIPAAFADEFYDEIGFISRRKQESGRRRTEFTLKRMESGDLIDEIVSVEKTGKQEEVYDITINDRHCFSANGILVHNSDKAAFQGSYDNVFGKPVIAEIFTNRQTSYDVYGIVGQSIEDRHEPRVRDFDYGTHEEPAVRVPVRWANRRGDVFRWELVPLKWQEPFLELSEIRDDTSHMGKFFQYIPPEPGYDYAIGIDTSNGIGEDGTCISVSRRGRNDREPDVQAAEFRDNAVSHVEAFAWGAAIAAYYSKFMNEEWGWHHGYRNPYISIEQIAAVGDTCQLQMRKLGISRFHRMTRYDSIPRKMRKKDALKEGWYTNLWSRPILTDTFVTLVQNGWYKLNSAYTIWEADHWEVHILGSGKSKFEHGIDSTDDGLFANALCAFCPNDQNSLANRTAKQFREVMGLAAPELDVTPTALGVRVRNDDIFRAGGTRRAGL